MFEALERMAVAEPHHVGRILLQPEIAARRTHPRFKAYRAKFNLPATAALARTTSIPVIASGGLAGLADIEALRAPEYAMLQGAIAGRALYDGRLDAREALAILASP